MALGYDPIGIYSLPNNNDVYYASADEIAYAIQKYDVDLYQAFVDNGFVLDTTDSFVTDSVNVLIGDLWNTIRTDLNDYIQYISLSEELNKTINETQQRCLKIVQDFLVPDEDLNTADLPNFEVERDTLQAEIANLEVENERLSQVPETICIGGSGTEEDPFTYSHNPQFDVAQAQISANNDKIQNILIPALNEVNRLINKINEFNTVILPLVEKELNVVSEKVNQFALQVDYIPTSNYNNLERFLSTGIVGLTSILGGGGKVVENIIDGAVWIDSKLTSWEIGIASSIVGLLGQENLTQRLDEYNKMYSCSQAEWIAIDHIENWNTEFYENSELGKNINEMSNMKYNSIEAQKLQDGAEKATIIGLEVGATVLSGGNKSAATAIGALNNIGEKAEETFINSKSTSLDDGTKNVLLEGLVGAAEGNAIGGLTTSLPATVKNTSKTIFSKFDIKDPSFKTSLKDSINNSLLSPDNAIQVIGTTAEAINDGNITVGKEAKDIITEYGTDVASSVVKLTNPLLSNYIDLADSLADSGMLEQMDKRIG